MENIYNNDAGIAEANWFKDLVEDLKEVLVEKETESRWSLIEGYHAVGTLIIENKIHFTSAGMDEGYITKYVSQAIGKGVRTIQKAVQFAQMFPSLDELPEGKNVTWNRICNKYLPKPKEAPAMVKLKDVIIEHARFLADNAQVDESGVTLFLPMDKIHESNLQLEIPAEGNSIEG